MWWGRQHLVSLIPESHLYLLPRGFAATALTLRVFQSHPSHDDSPSSITVRCLGNDT